MEGENNNIAKNAIIIYIRLIVTALVGIFSSRFILRALGTSDYGLYNVVGSFVTMMAFVNIVMVSTTYRYVAFELGKGINGNVNKVFNTSLIIHIIIATIVLLLSATLGEFYIDHYLKVDPIKLEDARFIFWTAICSCLISIICVPFNGLLTAFEKFNIMTIVEIVQRLLLLLISIIMMHFLGNRLRLYGFCVAILSALCSLSYLVYCKILYKPQVKWHIQMDKSLFREMVSFSWWIALGAAASVGQQQGAAIIVNRFFGTILNAAYGIANTIFSMVGQFSRALSQAAAPQITKNYSGSNQQRSIELASYISKYTVFFMLLFAVPIIAEANFLLKLWLGEDMVPPYAIVICQLALVNLVIGGMGEGIFTLIHATGKIKYFQIVLSTITLLSLPFSWFLFKLGTEPFFIIICFITASSINTLLTPYLLHRIIKLNVRRLLELSYLRILYVALSIIPFLFIVSLFRDSFLRLIIVIPSSIIYLLSSIWLVGMETNERTALTMFINHKIRKNDERD